MDGTAELGGKRGKKSRLVIVEASPFMLLSHQYAQHPAMMNDGRAHKADKRPISGIRDVAEAGMIGGSRQVDGFFMRRHPAHQPLVTAYPHMADRGGN
jgi:hypothetical protein